MAALCSTGSSVNPAQPHALGSSPPAKLEGRCCEIVHGDYSEKRSDATSMTFNTPLRSFWSRVIPSLEKLTPKSNATTCTSYVEPDCCRPVDRLICRGDSALPGQYQDYFLRILSLPLLAIIVIYRFTLSPLKSVFFGSAARCRFTPSCSAYSLEAIWVHGPFRGLWLGMKRLFRCHPWGGEGHDPVPTKRQKSVQSTPPFLAF